MLGTFLWSELQAHGTQLAPSSQSGSPMVFFLCLPPSTPGGLKLAFLQFVDKSGFVGFASFLQYLSIGPVPPYKACLNQELDSAN